MFPIPLLVTGLPALPRPLLSLSHPVSSLWLLAYVSSYLPPTLSLALAHALPIPASPPILYTSFPVLSSKTYVALVMTDSSSFLVPSSIAVAVSPKSSLPIFLTFAQTFLYSYQTHPPYPLIDIRVTHPSAPSYLSTPASSLAVASRHEPSKISKYSSLAKDSNSIFSPFILETFGALGNRASSFTQTLISLSRDSISNSLPTPPLLPSLAILLQKCNAYILSRGMVLTSSSRRINT